MLRVVDFRDVVATLDGWPALAGLTCTVERGEIVHVVGPNGAGKSTFLRACAGLVPLRAGAASVLGVDLARDRAGARARVGLLAHANGLYLDLTARENVAFWARATGAAAADAGAALAAMGVEGALADRRVGRMSAGERRRTALAVLLARRAELWLLDEPHAGLDAAARDALDATLRRARDAGATVVFASHESERASAVATRTLRIAGGAAA
ncbi:MAG: heme ABC exporter ATP-binding protein CcmA [Acidimicrobiia bacterium]